MEPSGEYHRPNMLDYVEVSQFFPTEFKAYTDNEIYPLIHTFDMVDHLEPRKYYLMISVKNYRNIVSITIQFIYSVSSVLYNNLSIATVEYPDNGYHNINYSLKLLSYGEIIRLLDRINADDIRDSERKYLILEIPEKVASKFIIRNIGKRDELLSDFVKIANEQKVAINDLVGMRFGTNKNKSLPPFIPGQIASYLGGRRRTKLRRTRRSYRKSKTHARRRKTRK